MGRMRVPGLLPAAVLALAMPGSAWAAGGNGVIVDVDNRARAFSVRETAGDRSAARPVVRTFRITDDTRITFRRKQVPFGHLVPGGHVSVRYQPGAAGPVATAVTIHPLRGR